MPRELTKNFKKCHFVVVFLKCYFEVSYFTQQQRTISPSDCGVWWKVDFIHYQQWPAQWLDWEEAPKHFPKPNLHQKKSWSLFGGLLPIWSNTAFWILTKPLHLKTMLSKSMRCTQNCNACPALINRKSLIHLHNNAQSPVTQPTVQKLNKLDYKDLPHPLYSPDLSPTDHHFFKHLNFLWGKCFHRQQDAEHAF